MTSQSTKLPFCGLCQKYLAPHRGTLAKRAQGAQHKEIVKLASVPQMLNFPKKPELSDDLKPVGLELALTKCCQMSTFGTLAIDHLGEVIKKNGKGSTLERLRFHHTKFRALTNFLETK